MASSRWKRFAFFDRSTLTVEGDVMVDLVPSLEASGRLPSSSREGDDVLSMAACIAALPLSSQKTKKDEPATESSISAMWSSLTACSAPQDIGPEGNIHLPNQSQMFDRVEISAQPVRVKDGLVLVFVASQESGFLHCIDVTVRCNPRDVVDSTDDDLDGWRGYWSPLPSSTPPRTGTGTVTVTGVTSVRSDDITLESESFGDRIMGIAACREGVKLLVATIGKNNVVVDMDPHLHLSCRIPLTLSRAKGPKLRLTAPWNELQHGHCKCVDIEPGYVVVGTDLGFVLVYTTRGGNLRNFMTIPSPSAGTQVTNVKISLSSTKLAIFVSYDRTEDQLSSRGNLGGVCCFDLGTPFPVTLASSPSARYDLDSRHVPSRRLSDYVVDQSNNSLQFMVARSDGLYTYSHTQKTAVSPIDGPKLAVCAIPVPSGSKSNSPTDGISSSYSLVASTDSKSGRDAIDVFDATNKLVAFHALLSPGHKALDVVGITTPPNKRMDGTFTGGRSSAIVLTTGGTLVTLTEKATKDKVNLLVQKNLFAAAISMAYADPSFEPTEITSLYRRHAEHLYRKGDFSAAMDQYINTIGSLESSHVIFRFLDAPKIPLLTRYMEELRSRGLATLVHNELLRTCYLKLNDNKAAEKIAASTSRATDSATSVSLVAKLTDNPKDALATICAMEAPQAAEALVVHGAALARAMPRETAGVVVSLCVGTYSPSALVEAAGKASSEAAKLLEFSTDERIRSCEPYPVHLFASAFIESPKMLRLILAHCNRNKCYLSPSLRRTLLELTLADWNNSKRSGDTETERLRRKEAITALTDAHCRDIGDYDALVIVQMAGFAEGELLLYERLQMIPMLLSRYAHDGGDRARRQMLAMCRNDPDILADVLGHFVEIAGKKVSHDGEDGDSATSEEEEILEDIREALALARSQGVLPPVRIARILAGEGAGRFRSGAEHEDSMKHTVPLSVALDYVGEILDQSRGEISRLRSEVVEYNELCSKMEAEIESLLGRSQDVQQPANNYQSMFIDIDDVHTKLRSTMEGETLNENRTLQSREAFWREMNQSEDGFDTIARFFAKGVIQ